MSEQSDSTRELLGRLVRGSGQEDLERLLSPGHVLVELGADAAREPQAQLLFSFAVNLVARLHPVVQRLEVVLPDSTPLTMRLPRWHADHLQEHLRRFLRELEPPLEWSVESQGTSESQVALVIGNGAPEAAHRVFVGANGWNVVISPSGPVPFGPLINPVGAHAAACMAVGEVWKRLLVPHRHLFPGRPIVPLEETLWFSCFTHRSDAPDDANPPLPEDIELGRITMVGLGAGGGAAAYTLASLHRMMGHLTVVEPDEVNARNLNRYVFASAEDAAATRLKTDLARVLFKHHPHLGVDLMPKSFREAVDELPLEALRHVVAAVHSREARRDIQYETPEVLWDAGATEEGDFRVWRIALGRTECMFCKHPPTDGDPEREEAAQLSDLFGFSVEMWLGMLRDNRPFGPDEIAALAARRQELDMAFDLPTDGERYSDWYRSQCGRLRLPERDQEVPIPFAPVMAGVLLAGEIIKERAFPTAVLSHYYGNTLVGSWMRRVLPYHRPPRPDCPFCRDPAFRSQWERRWTRRIESDAKDWDRGGEHER